MKRPFSWATGPLVVSLAYYLGAQIGFAMQSPVDQHSVLWLPNSILLTALLLAPPAQWAGYLAAAFPAQLLIGWQVGAVFPLTLLYTTNCVDAAAGAALVRRLSGGAFRFDGLRPMLAFIAGASVVTVLVSFADAGIAVATGFSADYWLAFSTRVRSNPLTHVVVVPTIVALLSDWRPTLRHRTAQMLVMLGTLLLVSLIVFSQDRVSGTMPAWLYAPLPLFVWAAIRFGAGGTGLGLLMVAFVSSWFAIRGVGPFALAPLSESVAALQMFLLALSVPLLVLSAIVNERNRAIARLRDNERALRSSETLLQRGYARIQEQAGRLILAQDAERTRIARDLQEDINQQLANLSITLSILRQRLRAVDDREVHDHLTRLQKDAFEVTNNIRHLSRDLHPVVLQHAGLAAALRVKCNEVHERTGTEVSLTCDPEAGQLRDEIAFGLFRVAQEALENVAEHADARHAWVRVSQPSEDSFELSVMDDGRGFDAATAAKTGMGLFRLSQRVRLLGGVVSIRSQMDDGTEIKVRLPVSADIRQDDAETA